MITIENLCVSLGNFAMKDINLEVAQGEYFVLLGPTGCGKTVLIECLVGIRKPSSGRIWIDKQDVTDRFPEERRVGYLPQDFAIFPHMTVETNISYGLRARKMDTARIKEKTGGIAETLGISHILGRYPQGLSGGEKQRVALARALVVEPKVVFLDEPLSALDEHTREKLADELLTICREFKVTFFHVSHNFEEVCQVADRAALMRTGSVEQIGAVHEILKHPISRYAAEFTRTKNIFEGTSELLKDGCAAVSLGNGISMRSNSKHSGKVLATIRPEAICVSDNPIETAENTYKGRIIKTYNKGIFTKIDIDIGILISAYMPNHSGNGNFLKNNEIIYVYIPPDSVNVIGSGTM